MGRVRFLCFSTFYFLLFLVNILVFKLNRYAGTAEAAYYAQHPFEAFLTMFFELGRNPVLVPGLLQMLAYSFILGFATEQVYVFLKKLFRLRAQREEG
ncbi:MAG: hypothetical protein FGF48_04610 [Candidatus Brockarchaeota archaeon]|nr:hypothetical protein [Candidatus Brockarchaeota archaeon]